MQIRLTLPNCAVEMLPNHYNFLNVYIFCRPNDVKINFDICIELIIKQNIRNIARIL